MTLFEVLKGDITHLDVDAIVNAANTTLLGGGGVDGAIHRAAGPRLLEECKKLRGCETGDAKITGGFNLPAKHIIHTVGPVWNGGKKKEADFLSSCYWRALEVAKDNGLKTVAFPCISTGVYRFPKQEAARIAVLTVREFIASYPHFDKIIFVCFSQEDYDIYQLMTIL